MKRVSIHFIFWLLYLLFEASLEYAWISNSYANLTPINRFAMAFTAELAIICVIKIPLTYLCFYLIELYGFKKQRSFYLITLLIIVNLLFLILYRLLSSQILLVYVYGEEAEYFNQFNRFISNMLDLMVIISIAVGLKQYRSSVNLKQREKNLISEKLEMELKMLKAQINPHFLFNTLNNIYALARKNANETAPSIMQLSMLLRYILYEANKPSVSLIQEIKSIEDFISLEKMRYTNRLTIHYENTIVDSNAKIAPLIVLTLVENAFKHGAAKSIDTTYITIRFRLESNKFYAIIENGKENNPDEEQNNQKQIGLQNISRQLSLLYNDYSLKIKTEVDTFCVELYINLNSHAFELHHS